MPYLAYEHEPWTMNFEMRDDCVGILGTMKPTKPALANADDLQSIELIAYKLIVENPKLILCIADEKNRVYKTVLNEGYYKGIGGLARAVTIVMATLVFCFTALTMEWFGVARGNGLFFFAGTCFVYGLLVYIRTANELEIAITCEVTLILLFLLTAAWNQAQSAG